jgi:hypothetical protein
MEFVFFMYHIPFNVHNISELHHDFRNTSLYQLRFLGSVALVSPPRHSFDHSFHKERTQTTRLEVHWGWLRGASFVDS